MAVGKNDIDDQFDIDDKGSIQKQKSTELWFFTKPSRPPPPYANFGPESDFFYTP